MRLLRLLTLAIAVAAIAAAPAAAYKVKDVKPPSGQVGVAYSFTFEADGGSAPHTFVVHSGGLPPGLTLSSEGAVSGTPTAAGAYSFYIQAADSTWLKSERKFTIDISPKLTIVNNSIPAATTGVLYSVKLSTSGGSASSWKLSAGSLPSGLTLTSNGTITGTPTTQGVWTFTVLASDGSRSDTKQLTLSVVAPVTVHAGALPPALVGTHFTTQLVAAGGTGAYTYSLLDGTLPAGLTFDTTTGVITGVARTAGTFPLVIGATAAGGGAAQWNLKLVVRPKLGFATSTLATAKVGRRYSALIATKGGSAPIVFTSVSTFPPGVQLNGDTGRLSGTPRRPGTYRFSVTVKDSFGGEATKRFTLRVAR